MRYLFVSYSGRRGAENIDGNIYLKCEFCEPFSIIYEIENVTKSCAVIITSIFELSEKEYKYKRTFNFKEHIRFRG